MRGQRSQRLVPAGCASRALAVFVLLALTAPGPLVLAAPGQLAAESPAPARANRNIDDAAAALACRGCHGAGSKLGDLGQWAPADILEALRGYRSGARAGTLMPRIARGFSDVELAAMAAALGQADDKRAPR